MNAAVNTRTRGLVQITRQSDSDKNWTCSIVFYGDQERLSSVSLGTAQVIRLFRTLGAPAPVSKKESHVVEFYNTPDLAELKELGFFTAG
ncbi:MAG: hypothetical protein IPM23_13130 [Candidatus Melainabacteria bacterium]|nr:hypothetical protein [Candidatus Melainabacteria bacterium]